VGAGEGGWAWPELAVVDEREGGAPLAHRDALTLLAAMLQHTDSKPEQQRIVCLSPVRGAARNGSPYTGAVCDRPFLLIQDLGKTFGRSHPLNSDATASVSLDDWRATPVWDDPSRCVARLQRSATGTLANPRISEAGRAFLAGLLAQITDAQLRDLFDVARFPTRATPVRPHGASVEEWAAAFKQKRDEIASVMCR
jgi:hypothetical protein